MTEDKAKKKWCPFVRELGDEGASYNRGYKGQPVGRCIGAECMAWRWNERSADEDGFCGLAGAPQ